MPPVAPPADGWARIEAALEHAKPGTSASEGLWQSLAFWRSPCLGHSALAVACLAGLIYLGAISPPSRRCVARLDGSCGKSASSPPSIPADGSLTIVPAALLGGEEKMRWSSGSFPPAASRIRSG